MKSETLASQIKQRMESPFLLSVTYAALASVSVFATAHLQGCLFSIPTEIQKYHEGTIWPYIDNISTIVDFLFLNPLTIFLLQKSSLEARKMQSRFPQKNRLTAFHRVGLLGLAAAIAFVSMKLYYDGFLTGQYFDSNILPGANGPYITPSGWVVFFWTMLFMAFLFYHVFIYAWHVLFIVSLSSDDILYTPFHPDESGGLRFLMAPSLTFLYAMMALLGIFVVFVFQDTFYDINESNRHIGFVVYALVSIPLFYAPLFHVHLLMKHKKRSYLNDLHAYAETIFTSHSPNVPSPKTSNQQRKRMEYVESIESINKYKGVLDSFPLWPLPRRTFVTPVSSFVGALLPTAAKTISPYIAALFS